MSENKLTEQRSHIIEKFINIEWLLNAIICQNYLGIVKENFLFEVLYDEYFSSSLKIRILEKIVSNQKKKLINNLRRLSTIRNYFAHLDKRIIKGPSKFGPSFIPSPKDHTKPVNFESLFEEFEDKNNEVLKELEYIFHNMGGELHNS